MKKSINDSDYVKNEGIIENISIELQDILVSKNLKSRKNEEEMTKRTTINEDNLIRIRIDLGFISILIETT
jgi:hypothetical protein